MKLLKITSSMKNIIIKKKKNFKRKSQFFTRIQQEISVI
jgi:hypothetical protein